MRLPKINKMHKIITMVLAVMLKVMPALAGDAEMLRKANYAGDTYVGVLSEMSLEQAKPLVKKDLPSMAIIFGYKTAPGIEEFVKLALAEFCKDAEAMKQVK